jgi:hypothetical protein
MNESPELQTMEWMNESPECLYKHKLYPLPSCPVVVCFYIIKKSVQISFLSLPKYISHVEDWITKEARYVDKKAA